ncbi:LOW QUALITY PROTEIN: uncharacterized protein LOC113788835 [Dermatophagoides pteronyssinus]|uniref:LOW QUALITY PROTEIN: uncharacterized protein LOC113788835 n=1 Tax=Dermatophagoides pteronyssinus TaxID=6956 RepID=UPI003F66F149
MVIFCLVKQQQQRITQACYFPIEYQGTFLIQTQGLITPQIIDNSQSGTTNQSSVTYSEVIIEADAIQPWGRCHKRRGNNVILKDSTGAGQDCLRCFHISMKTSNVISLHSDGLERCYTNEEAARATCPLDKDIGQQQKRKFKEIILFRKHVPGGLQSIEHVFCPFNGRFRFSYVGSSNQQQPNQPQMRCEFGYSEMSNCPHGNALNVKFRKCSFQTMDIHFLCLGDWPVTTSTSIASSTSTTTTAGNSGINSNERYLALMDLREAPEANRPKYRCGLYREDPLTGQITVSLSSDSTCTNQLTNSSVGYESLILSPLPNKRIPPMVESSKCRFPDWMQGRWQRTKVDNQQFIYKDAQNQFRTIRSRCIQRQIDQANDRFIVHSITQCGEQSFSCLWVKRRSPNIMEFKFSDKSSSIMNDKLCDDRNFLINPWITEGKEKIVAQSTPCPITGDYTGEVPGASGLCAKVASDCNNPDIMFYSVSSCENRSHVYEEREYRCLGNWEEDGVLYTFTQRRDMPGHQCFAGKVYRNGDEAYIKEAGEDSCMRGEDEDPIIFGMKIAKQASCPRHIIPKPMIPSTSSMLPHLPSSLPTNIRNHHQHGGGHSSSSSSDVQQSGHKSQSSIGQSQTSNVNHHSTINKFSYPPIIKPLMPTLSPPSLSSQLPAIVIGGGGSSGHHPSFKPIHVDHHHNHPHHRTNGNDNGYSPPSQQQPQAPSPPFWQYDSTDLQSSHSSSSASKTHYRPIVDNGSSNNQHHHLNNNNNNRHRDSSSSSSSTSTILATTSWTFCNLLLLLISTIVIQIIAH